MKQFAALVLSLALLMLTACSYGHALSQNETTALAPAGSLTTTTTTAIDETEDTTSSDTDVLTSEISTPSTRTPSKPPSSLPSTTKPVTTSKQPTQPSTVTSGEMRGAWASYIELDALFKSCTTAAAAKKAINGMLDTLEEFKVNTLFFHVRANSDAYYKSSLFKPATSVSKLINAGFDPLLYTVQAAHSRGIEVHAWINPYRAGKNTAYLVSGIPTFRDADGRYYYVPTSSKSQKLILDGVRELVNNYAIDGVQYDDYFYPSGVLGNAVADFEKTDYQQSGGNLSIADWRRAAVDSLIASTHSITKAKNRVFGVSPAVNAKNTYDTLYANPKKWLAQSGYVDYICPQIYTGFAHSGSAFDKMTDTWLSYPRHSSVKLYVGLAVYKAGLLSDAYAGNGKTEWANNSDILKRSVLYLRSKKISGFAFYSYSYLKPKSSSTIDVSVAKKEMQNLLTIL